MRSWISTVLAVSFAVSLLGCSAGERDHAEQTLSTEADKAGKEIKGAAEKAKVATDSDVESAKVKSALSSASGLNAKDIAVDSDSVAKTTVISGLVPDAKQKAQALSIAKGIAGNEYKVVDKLQIAIK